MTKRTILVFILLIAILLSGVSSAFAQTGNPKIDYLIEKGLLQGDGDGNYNLSSNVTRAEMAALIVRLLDLEVEASTLINNPTGFTDVKAGFWAAGYINVVKSKNIINGYPNGTFKPNNNVTYEEAITMLARVAKNFTPAELAQAKFPSTYVATATKLGVLVGIPITNLKAPITRQKVLEAVYNTDTSPLIAKNEGKPGTPIDKVTTVKGVVVENARVGILKDNQIKLVTSDNKSHILTVDDKFDVESVLGKGVEIKFDSTNKVVKCDFLSEYKYVSGLIEDLELKSMIADNTSYRINDIPVTYLNGKSTLYNGGRRTESLQEIADKEDVFAIVTIKDQEVLFIEAYTFTDVFPVIKIDSKGPVSYADDSRFGDLNSLNLSKYTLINLDEKSNKQTLSLDDLDENDIIHVVKNDLAFVSIKSDSLVEGRLDSLSENRKGTVMITVDTTDYPVVIGVKSKTTLYNANGQYYNLTSDFRNELSNFLKEEVLIYTDLLGRVQLITSEKETNFGYGIVVDELRGDFKIFTSLGSEWYSTTNSTKVIGVAGSKGTQISNIRVNDLVRFNSTDGDLIEIEVLTSPDKIITNVDSNAIRFSDGNFNYTDKRTVVFNKIGKNITTLAVEDFYKVFDKQQPITGYIYTNVKDNSKVAEVIVVTSGTLQNSISTDNELVILNRVLYGKNDTEIRVEFENGKTETYVLSSEKLIDKIELGAIIEIYLSNSRIPEITKINEIIKGDNENYFEVVTVRRDSIELKDASGEKKILRLSSKSIQVGNIRESDIVEISSIDSLNTIKAIRKVDATKATGYFNIIDLTLGQITYVETRLGREGFEIVYENNKTDFINLTGMLRSLASTLNIGDTVRLIYEKGELIDVTVLVKVTPGKVKQIMQYIEDLNPTKSVFAQMVDFIRVEYDKLEPEHKLLVTNYQKLVDAEKLLATPEPPETPEPPATPEP